MKTNRNGAGRDQKREPISPCKARKIDWANQIVTHYLRGNSQGEVRRIMLEETGHGFGINTIAKYIQEATEEWKENKNQQVDAHKAIELEKINRLETEYWLGWERSKNIVKVKSRLKRKDGDDKGLKIFQQRDDERDSLGDPRFLNGVQWCIDKRCEILGIEIPQGPVIQVNNNTQNNNSDNRTTIVRRVVFKTRETTTAPQIIEQNNE